MLCMVRHDIGRGHVAGCGRNKSFLRVHAVVILHLA